jgi:glycosyltransferase 2 family protein
MTENQRANNRWRRVVAGFLGVAFGAALFFFALRGADIAEVKRIFDGIAPLWVALAWLVYAATIALRVLRWRLLLKEIVPELSVSAVGETLLVGYAVNNVLPARLGELFRADYAKRRLGIGRAGALGSIITERLLDGLMIITLLWIGLVLVRWQSGDSEVVLLKTIALSASLFISVVIGFVVLLTFFGGRFERLPPWLGTRIGYLIEGMVAWRRGPTLAVGMLTVMIWIGEACALGLVFRATGILLTGGQTASLMGSASLSTLIPTAPAYLGSYQYVFVVAMRAFARPESAGIVAATVIQAVFYGSVTLSGLSLLIYRAAVPLRKRSSK